MSGLIMVTGASGHLGRQVLEFLLDRVPASRVAALARQPAALAGFAQSGVTVRYGDYRDPGSLEPAFRDVDKLLLVSATAFTDVKTAHRNVVQAAKAAGVGHLHYTAIQRRPGSRFVIPQVTEWDEYTEKELQASGLDVTVLRNSQYLDSLDDLIGDLAPDRVIRVPAGHAVTAQATRRDIAEATAAVLATSGHAGHSYTLAGSRAVSLADITAILAEVTGSPVTYQDTPVEDYVSDRVRAGMPETAARFTAAWFQAIAAGEFASPGDIERLTGRPPTPVRAFLAQRRARASAITARQAARQHEESP
jgi:NAD(P)H dehydrogenase (quinone)